MAFLDDIKKTYARIDAKIDNDLIIHDALYKAFVVPMGSMLDGAKGEGIKNDFKPHDKGETGKIPKAGGDFTDGAEGEGIKKNPAPKAGSGSSGNVPKGGAPVEDGATGAKIERK